MSDKLNATQSTALAVTLRNLERALLDVEALCSDDRAEQLGILLRMTNPLTQAQRAGLAAQLAEARRTLALLATRFALPSQSEDQARSARSKLVIAWATLEDIKSYKLGRYGKVSPALEEDLDPQIDKLIGVVTAMERILPVD
jgi:hypothetical protein